VGQTSGLSLRVTLDRPRNLPYDAFFFPLRGREQHRR
jgi:hypothetical protein